MLKTPIKFVSDNIYLFLGIIIGLYISSFVTTTLDISCDTSNQLGVDRSFAQQIINSSINRLAPKILPEMAKGETKSKFVRPRYYSTELGIREKLFVGIFTSADKVNTQALHINKTIGHLVDKIKFFITAQYKLKSKFNLTGLVGFTDARSKYRPFQVIKYVADTFAQDYDYYFFASDITFINAHRLRDIVDKISISMDVYLGTKVPDSSFCNLDAGIVLSNSVLRAARQYLEWCIMNAVSDDNSENLGRCIHHSLGLSCQESVQEQSMPSFKLKHFDLPYYLSELKANVDFNKAVTIRPVIANDDFFRLNAYFLKQRLEIHNKQIKKLSESLKESWPPGINPGVKPATRFDVPRQYYFNMTHVYFPDDFTVLKTHTEPELLDIQNIIQGINAQVSEKYPKRFEFRRLVNGYKTFDLSRGMDYTFDIGFRDLKTGKEIVKRFEVCKPLGSVEFIPAPYVTENSRVSIILPIQETEIAQAVLFLNNYNREIMLKKEKTFLLLVFLYQYDSNSKGGVQDPFNELKSFATTTASKFTNDEVKIAWLSIRLPKTENPLELDDHRVLRFAIVDLALKKIGLESLTLFLDVWSNISVDFLNRVRMNTLENYQIFSPIPFRQYDPKITQIPNLSVNKSAGHFDREEFKYISFYGRDYVAARKKIQSSVPLVRVDNDISKLIDIKHTGNIFEMFIKHGGDVHCMRATEMNLKVFYHEEQDENRVNKFYGVDAQLAKLLLTKEGIPELL
ncbi:chondroitin sulfate glucuronyltransferase [Anthonomus grandis grandis]|uniref:chondroitin sulfate glucuronyltransferase n=1 Tax=Anthonomus grandis grandis TaxID=2921223 RepID=UPI002166AD57|nr:chondroitin sulfate glucuronyltransferase [Anthonomus grandis grandis]